MKNKSLVIVILFVAVLFASARAVYALDLIPFEIVFSRLSEEEQGPDEVFLLEEYGLVCVFKDGSLDCECPCGEQCGTVGETVAVAETQPPSETQPPAEEAQPPVETEEPVPPTDPTPGPPPEWPTPTPPAPTLEPNGVLIRHRDAKGNIVWEKCMPLSAWNGHEDHFGHEIQDEFLGYCYR